MTVEPNIAPKANMRNHRPMLEGIRLAGVLCSNEKKKYAITANSTMMNRILFATWLIVIPCP